MATHQQNEPWRRYDLARSELRHCCGQFSQCQPFMFPFALPDSAPWVSSTEWWVSREGAWCKRYLIHWGFPSIESLWEFLCERERYGAVQNSHCARNKKRKEGEKKWQIGLQEQLAHCGKFKVMTEKPETDVNKDYITPASRKRHEMPSS